MVFSSVQFLFVFLPLVLAFYYILPCRARNGVLLAFSLLFYAWGGVGYTALILISILGNYLAGRLLGRFEDNNAARRGVLIGAVVFNLAMLGYFKYYDFFAGSVNAVAGGTILPIRNIMLPIGISFYTFQAMSYVIDLYRRQIGVQKNLFDFALYVALFPQLIAGPIVRYKDIEAQLENHPSRLEDFCYGIKRFVLGLGKKVLLANQLGLTYSAVTAVDPGLLPCGVLWLGYLSYSLQLYYDFSGYSDMAIGLGRMFGFRFPENFDYPYLSKSIGEYWRRWHMTLSGWFREYVYFPLGGSRRGAVRTCVNLFVVFVLTGLWHGAAWQYVVFGIYHGCFMILERVWLAKRLQKLPAAFQHLYALLFLQLGLVVFGAPGLSSGLGALRGMLTGQDGAAGYRLAQFVSPKIILYLLAAILLCGPLQALCKPLKKWLYREEGLAPAGMVFLALVLFYSVVRVTAGSYNPFIYFRF